MNTRQRRLFRFAILAVLVGLFITLLVYVAQNKPTDASWYPKCQFHSATGWHCPGCGLTRSVHSYLNGEISQALAYHTFSFIVLPIFFISIARSLWAWAWHDGKTRVEHKSLLPLPGWFRYVTIGLILLFWVVRNIPVEPFTYLAPHELTP